MLLIKSNTMENQPINQDPVLLKDIEDAKNGITEVLGKYNLDLVAYLDYSGSTNSKAEVSPRVAFVRPEPQTNPVNMNDIAQKQQGDFVATRTDEQIALDEAKEDKSIGEIYE